MRRLAAAVLSMLALGAVIAPSASAHPDLLGTTPTNGSQGNPAPSRITFRLDGTGTLSGQGSFLYDQAGRRVPTTAKMADGRRSVVVTPKSALRTGPYEAVVQIRSDEDGHTVQYPMVFCVGSCPPRGGRTSVDTDSGIKVTVDGTSPGQHTFTIATKARKGVLQLSSSTTPAPLEWKIVGNGKRATATGIIPFSSDWTAVLDLGKGGLHVATFSN